jgi:hypothetical protein
LIKQSVAAARLYQQTLEKLALKCRNPRLQGVSFFSACKKVRLAKVKREESVATARLSPSSING